MLSPPPVFSPWLIVPPYSNSVSDFHFLCGCTWCFSGAWCCVVSVWGCIWLGCVVLCCFLCPFFVCFPCSLRCFLLFWCCCFYLCVVGFGVSSGWFVVCCWCVWCVVFLLVGCCIVLVGPLFCWWFVFLLLVLLVVGCWLFFSAPLFWWSWLFLQHVVLVRGCCWLVRVGWLFFSWCCVAGPGFLLLLCFAHGGSLVVGWCWLVRCFAPGAGWSCSACFWLLVLHDQRVLAPCCSWFFF